MEDNYDISKLKPKKKRIHSKRKGNKFERDICKLLNERFDTKEFERSPNSGAYASTHNLPEYLKLYGDLITPINFKYTIECKKGYNNISFYNFLRYDSPDFWNLVKQSEKDSNQSGKPLLLIIKQDRKPALAVIKEDIDLPNMRLKKESTCYYMYFLDDLIGLPDEFWLTQ